METLAKRFAGREKQICGEILNNGIISVSLKEGCGVESLTNYARNKLLISDPPLTTHYSRSSTSDLTIEFISAMYEIWKRLEEDNKRLKDEVEGLKQAEMKKETVARVRLIEMMQGLKA